MGYPSKLVYVYYIYESARKKGQVEYHYETINENISDCDIIMII